ncbi:helix-turn-helix domain-containing protein [Roseateles toxinivorans]|uniref:Helix-turn-helix protein n=1 Tax=Roseateles toxinivorans TaxID=270368 RepID=A0A4R6QTT0_9BURK|nr:helix-turn-helix domain-containing protein [Roseateles toxinivorans]TDP74132.1 helix-turn-helix protein [Roseateles toxinivorans]
MDEKKTTPEKEAALKSLRDQFTGLDAATQKTRLLAALQLFPVTTFEASRFLDVYHPAGRIRDLRDDGHEILTLWTDTTTEAGVTHRIGRYVLVRMAQQEQAA